MEQSDDRNGKVASVLRKSLRLNPNVEGSDPYSGKVTPSPPTTEVPKASQIGSEPPAPAALKSLPLKRKSQRPPPGGCDHDGRRRRSARLNPIEELPQPLPTDLTKIDLNQRPNLRAFLESIKGARAKPAPAPEPEPESDPEPESWSDPEPVEAPEAEPQSDQEPQSDPEAEPQSDSEAEPQSDPEAEPQSDQEPVEAPEPEPESAPEPEPAPELEPLAETEPEPVEDPEPEAAPEPVGTPESWPEPAPEPVEAPEPEPPAPEAAPEQSATLSFEDSDNVEQYFNMEDSDHMEESDNETLQDYDEQSATLSFSDTTVPSAEPNNSGQPEPTMPVLEDDGSRRYRKRRGLRMCPEAMEASGKDLDWSAAKVQTVKRKRNRKGKKSAARGVRGPAKPRDPVHPDSRPVLKVVGDREFTSQPECTRITSTIRLLTCECLPGPIRSFNVFPTKVRLQILRKFLQRYSWADGEDVGRCLDVFENIAAEAWSRVLTGTRRVCRNKFGMNKELWRDFCPPWCKNMDHWKGLVDIWMNPKWEEFSNTNRENRTSENAPPISHVGGSRSSYRHKIKLIAEKGSAIDLKDVFDRTHLKKSPEGKVYVSQRAKEAAERYTELKALHGNAMDDEAIWDNAVKGEDKRGRLYGFGNRSRMSKANRELELIEASPSEPSKSTATSAEQAKNSFTAEEVSELIKKNLDSQRKAFDEEMAARDMRHRAEMEEVQKVNEYNNACFATLFAKTGAKPPKFFGGPSRAQSSAGGRADIGGGEEPSGGGGGSIDRGEEP